LVVFPHNVIKTIGNPLGATGERNPSLYQQQQFNVVSNNSTTDGLLTTDRQRSQTVLIAKLRPIKTHTKRRHQSPQTVKNSCRCQQHTTLAPHP